jgi:hypothetical protein
MGSLLTGVILLIILLSIVVIGLSRFFTAIGDFLLRITSNFRDRGGNESCKEDSRDCNP